MPQQQRTKQASETLLLSDNSMAHLYRGELGRSDRWRTRLDTTTNWAITTTAAVISFGFTRGSSHVTFLVGIWLVCTFLFIEARRYRYYDLWNRRVRLLEDGYWAPMLRQEPVDPDAIKELAAELARPQLQLSLFSAISTRLNRAYGPILLVMVVTWFVKVFSQPHPAKTFREFFDRAHVGLIPGEVIVVLLLMMAVLFFTLFLLSFFARAPLGELRMRPRSRRLELWERFYRPYAVSAPRRGTTTRPLSRAARESNSSLPRP